MAEYVCELTDDYPGIEFGDEDYSGTCERRERIVRCRDCKHCEDVIDCDGVRGRLKACTLIQVWDNADWSIGFPLVDASGFCAWGERRGE